MTSLNASNLGSGTVDDARLGTSSLFETGMIMLWYGSVVSIPSGWVLCDGNNSTPDLRNRFVIGAGTGGNYSPDDTGGSADATLVSHSHNINNHTHSFSGSDSHSHTINNHTHSFSGSSSHSHGINDPGHTHTMNFNQGNIISSGGAFGLKDSGTANRINTNTTGISVNSQSVTISGNTGGTGGGQAHENRPPYYLSLIHI